MKTSFKSTPLAVLRVFCSAILAAALRNTLKRFALALTTGAAMYFGASPASAAPPVTTGLKVHLDASQLTGLSDGATVTSWTDMSGSGNHATKTAGTPIYKTGALNGKPVIRFNNASSFTTANLSSQFPSATTGFIVTTINNDNEYTLVKAHSGFDEWWRWGGSGKCNPGFFRSSRIESYCPMPNSGSHLFAISSSASAWEMTINGVSQGVAGGKYNAGGAHVIGNGSAGQGLNGDIAEVIIYSRVLTAAEVEQVGVYLAQKYGLVTSYGPPVISSLRPTDNDADVPVDDNLVATFNEAIVRGTGNITVKNLTDATQTTIAVTDTTQVSISGKVLTINPTADLVGGKNYAIQIAPTAIKDIANNTFAGITNDTNWNFTTVAQFPYQTWTYSGSLFILTTPDGANITSGAAETNFPLLVRFNSGNFPFNRAAADGRDIRFTTVTGTALSYQIEQWDAANGRAAVWVKIPSIAANARQEIKMYWGKTGVASGSRVTSVFNAANGYASVHHLGDTLVDEVGTTTPTNSNTTAINGLIGRSRSFAAGQGMQSGASVSGLPSGAGPFSTGVWIRPSTSGTTVLGWGIQSGQNKVVMSLATPPRISMDSYFGGANVTGSAAIPLSEWSYVVHTFQSNSTRLYVNGVLDASTGGGIMNMPTTGRFDIGGFVPTGGFEFVGEMDEVRISNVARSADWIKLEYENQKPLQTLIGGIVPSGSGFSVTPTSVTMNEVATITLNAQAGGAQKVYWILKKNDQETVLATDQLTLNYTAPRISGNDSAVIQFKAVFAGGTKTIDVPVMVIDTVPDPVFTLAPSATSWDGRSTMTVNANITNLAAMQNAGFGTLNYKWSVSGVAVAKQSTEGKLTLTRSQGSGPMNVSLTIDNGGAPVSQTVIINVQEPASDPWVQRTPAADEKPVNGQFFARDPGTGLGTIFYNGKQDGTPDTVFLKVYKTPDGGAETLETTHRQALVGGAYAFTAPITAGLNTYRVVYGTTTGGVDTDVATVSDLVCGDAFIIEGQSNALATDNSAPNDTTTNNKWIRTYGLTSKWGYAISKGNDLQLGLWGWYLANRLVTRNNMPICIINGAAGGTRIDMHRPNPTNHSLPLGSGWSENIYANLYNRVVGAKLTHGIRGLLWHQGEQDQGAIGPDGDYNYKFYQQYFVDISAAWKQDFPNLRNYYLFQIWPAACGETSRNDQLREVQRTLPNLYSNMKIMSTHGIVPGSGCHYEPLGYQKFSDLIGPLVEQDVYGVNPTAKLTAPNLQRAYFTTGAKNEIALVFDQNVAWNPGAPTMLFLANSAGATSGSVSSGSATGNTIKLQVSEAASTATITYLKGLVSWQQPNLLYGSTNGIAALTFADIPVVTLIPTK